MGRPRASRRRPQSADVSLSRSERMSVKIDTHQPSSMSGHLRDGADLRRRAAGATAFDVLPYQVDVGHPTHAPHPLERPARQRRHGHGDRSRGLAIAMAQHGGTRRHPQESVNRGAGVGSRPREPIESGMMVNTDHAVAHAQDLQSTRSDEEVPEVRRADHRRRQQGRPARAASSRIGTCGSRPTSIAPSPT